MKLDKSDAKEAITLFDIGIERCLRFLQLALVASTLRFAANQNQDPLYGLLEFCVLFAMGAYLGALIFLVNLRIDWRIFERSKVGMVARTIVFAVLFAALLLVTELILQVIAGLASA